MMSPLRPSFSSLLLPPWPESLSGEETEDFLEVLPGSAVGPGGGEGKGVFLIPLFNRTLLYTYTSCEREKQVDRAVIPIKVLT